MYKAMYKGEQSLTYIDDIYFKENKKKLSYEAVIRRKHSVRNLCLLHKLERYVLHRLPVKKSIHNWTSVQAVTVVCDSDQ